MDLKSKFVLYFHDWCAKANGAAVLRASGKQTLVSEYLKKMKGHIYCPECLSDMHRSPHDKEVSSNGRSFFSHNRGQGDGCSQKSKKAEGKRYDTEEDVAEAVNNGELVVISGFIKDKPVALKGEAGEYDQTLVEDEDGPLVDIPIGRHRGETAPQPSKFKTVKGLTKRFDLNLYRYFYMPDFKLPIQLQDLLTDIKSVGSTDEKPKLYFGKIRKSEHMGTQKPHHLRMTWLEYVDNGEIKDFCFKLSDELQAEKGIDDDAVGRYVIMYGSITTNGIGLCIESIGWGEFALLPEKYKSLIES